MTFGNQGGSGPHTEADPLADVSAADLLEVLWATMCDVLGTAATATLLRRAIRRAESYGADLGGVTVGRTAFGYEYAQPDDWYLKGHKPALNALRLLVFELRPLLIEMTGPVVVRRLDRVPLLQRLGAALGDGR